MKKHHHKRQTIGIALGAGGAKGFVHLGVLKVLHKHKLYPDYIAGTSMGAVIAAAYAAGRTPLEIEEFMKHTSWQNVIDFTVPKSGLLAGRRVNHYLEELVLHKKIQHTRIPLRIVSYNLTKRKQFIFERGEITNALRASISIPGIFQPYHHNNEQYVDGALANPTPYDVVRKMGADIILAVDTTTPFPKESRKALTREESFLSTIKERFIREEVQFLGVVLFPERWPAAIRKTLRWLLRTIFYPSRVLRMLAGRELFPIAKTMYESMNILQDNLAKERLAQAKDCIIITPRIDGLQWSDFNKIDQFIKMGEEATEKIIPELKKRLRE
ncbi:patatin-like phospholipase family protein [Candidatus Woesearchaeota archaeon]|nr:patatin-like phospholipase family protein [Candidatus Woesearchaeota archaeon]